MELSKTWLKPAVDVAADVVVIVVVAAVVISVVVDVVVVIVEISVAGFATKNFLFLLEYFFALAFFAPRAYDCRQMGWNTDVKCVKTEAVELHKVCWMRPNLDIRLRNF